MNLDAVGGFGLLGRILHFIKAAPGQSIVNYGRLRNAKRFFFGC